MHRSRLCAISIDCPATTANASATFWSAALRPDAAPPAPLLDDDPYTTVGWVAGREVFVQQLVDGDAHFHLDIETDDVAAEVARLEALGATRVEAVETWQVMRDPSGHLFCVVRPQTDDFPGDAASWD